MSEKVFKAKNNYTKDKSKHPLHKISSGLSKAQAERLAKYSK